MSFQGFPYLCFHLTVKCYVYKHDITSVCIWVTSHLAAYEWYHFWLYMRNITSDCIWVTPHLTVYEWHRIWLHMSDITSGIHVFSHLCVFNSGLYTCTGNTSPLFLNILPWSWWIAINISIKSQMWSWYMMSEKIIFIITVAMLSCW